MNTIKRKIYKLDKSNKYMKRKQITEQKNCPIMIDNKTRKVLLTLKATLGHRNLNQTVQYLIYEFEKEDERRN